VEKKYQDGRLAAEWAGGLVVPPPPRQRGRESFSDRCGGFFFFGFVCFPLLR